MNCPVCRNSTGYYKQECVEPGSYETRPYPLYQRSYQGSPEYVSPRCIDCYGSRQEVPRVNIVTDQVALRRPCNVVGSIEYKEMAVLAEQMVSVLKEVHGQGLAANQIGVSKRMFVIMVEGRTPMCFVNPRLFPSTKWQESNEGCLSLPGVKVRIKRPLTVRVDGLNQYGKPVSHKFTGIDARRVCHEVDHLNGKLIIDYKEVNSDSSNQNKRQGPQRVQVHQGAGAVPAE